MFCVLYEFRPLHKYQWLKPRCVERNASTLEVCYHRNNSREVCVGYTCAVGALRLSSRFLFSNFWEAALVMRVLLTCVVMPEIQRRGGTDRIHDVCGDARDLEQLRGCRVSIVCGRVEVKWIRLGWCQYPRLGGGLSSVDWSVYVSIADCWTHEKVTGLVFFGVLGCCPSLLYKYIVRMQRVEKGGCKNGHP